MIFDSMWLSNLYLTSNPKGNLFRGAGLEFSMFAKTPLLTCENSDVFLCENIWFSWYLHKTYSAAKIQVLLMKEHFSAQSGMLIWED